MFFSSCTIQSFNKNYEITLLDQSNHDQTNQLRQFILNAPIHTTQKPTFQDFEQWLTNSEALLAINTQGVICGAAVYYISHNNELWIRTITLSSKHQSYTIATQLLQQLESTPNIINVGTRIIEQHIALCKIFKKLGYTQTDRFLIMHKSIIDFPMQPNQFYKFHIRSLNANNANEIKLFAELFDAHEMGASWTPKQMEQLINKKNYKFLAAFDNNGQLCGGLIYKLLPTFWKIDAIAVRKDYRRRGIATELIQSVEKFAQEQGISELTIYVLPTNLAALTCYKKANFIAEEITIQIIKNLN